MTGSIHPRRDRLGPGPEADRSRKQGEPLNTRRSPASWATSPCDRRPRPWDAASIEFQAGIAPAGLHNAWFNCIATQVVVAQPWDRPQPDPAVRETMVKPRRGRRTTRGGHCSMSDRRGAMAARRSSTIGPGT